ncbi:MAG: hypothetical protein IJC80_06665 [Clostridia bacterium]|nr:hypothetical protein [Clostridia bacterium]
MKILVFSDSHGRAKNIVEALEIHGGVCDFAVFLGDGLKDIDYVIPSRAQKWRKRSLPICPSVFSSTVMTSCSTTTSTSGW